MLTADLTVQMAEHIDMAVLVSIQPHVHSVNHQILSMPGVAAVVTGMVHTVKAGLEAVEMAEIGLTTLHLAEHLEQVVVVDYAKDGGMMLAPVVLELQ